MATVGLIAIATPGTYENYARQLFASACKHVQLDLTTILLPARPGWPDATLYRYHVVLEHEDDLNFDYLYLCDADMRFEGSVGKEILGKLVATRHPGYIASLDLPFERRKESAAYLHEKARGPYYAGGFVGGETKHFLRLAAIIANQIDQDDEKQLIARWHDESHLNHVLHFNRPSVVLTASYCYPDDAGGYPWLRSLERKLVALDKTPAERNGR